LTILDIMLPYYGDVALMQLAVRSVIDQTDDRWQLTVVDDGDAEGVPEWFKHLDHPRIRYERNPVNLGITANFQRCLDLVSRDYSVIMGCDDVMLPNYVRTVVDLIERRPDVTIVQPGVEVIDGSGRPVRTLVDRTKQRLYAPRFEGTTTLRGEALAVSLLRGDWLYFPSLCWRSEAIRAVGFDVSLSVIQDLSLILQMVERGATLVAMDELCFQYRRHAVSLSATAAASGVRFREAKWFFLDVAARMDARGWRRAARTARWHTSSRLHALTLMPAAARTGNVAGMRALAEHVVGMRSRRNVHAKG
jgi:glycosyltransferase involved in cell wall biosynthesis